MCWHHVEIQCAARGRARPLWLLAFWSIGSWTGSIDHRTLSPPWVVVQADVDLAASGRLWDNFETSPWRAVQGLVLGVFAGGVLGVISGLSRISEYLIDGPVQIKRSIPSLGKRFNLLSE